MLAHRPGITQRVHAHGLRHTFAYELVMEGVPVNIIQKQLGHIWLSSTGNYVDHIAPIQVVEAIGERTWDLGGQGAEIVPTSADAESTAGAATAESAGKSPSDR